MCQPLLALARHFELRVDFELLSGLRRAYQFGHLYELWIRPLELGAALDLGWPVFGIGVSSFGNIRQIQIFRRVAHAGM